MAYLQEAFAIGRTNTENTSLPGEPLVLLYNDTLLDIANGITEAQRLETANVLLAIGRGGDGVNIFNNQDYFVIDFAKHDEEIQMLIEQVGNIQDIVITVQETIGQMQENIKNNNDDISAIIKQIGEKGDQREKDTVYGYIQGAYNDIKDEETRALQTEQDLRHSIENEATRITNLQTQIDTEENARIEGDEINRDAIDAEVLRATNVETELRDDLENEISRATANDNDLNAKISINTQRIAENQVSSNRKTILVTGPSTNGTNIDVNIDNKTIVADETGILSVSSDALIQYSGVNAIQVSEIASGIKSISLQINPNDKILTNDISGLLASLSLKWNHADATGQKDEIQLIGKDGIVISRIDVADFIKDGILDNVILNTADANNPYLSFTFNSAAGKETINVPVKDLVVIYFAGNGLTLNENIFSVKLDANSEAFLTVSENGIKLTGVQNAINNAKTEVTNQITNGFAAVNANITILEQTLKNNINDCQTEITKINGDVNIDGSIKDIVFDSALGAIVNTITVENANEQSLIKKFTNEGKPYIYVSNDTSDMKHDGDALNNVIAEMLSAINSLQNELNTTKNELEIVQNNLSNAQAEIQYLQTFAITNIEGTAKEIKVEVYDNKATIGFAEDAYFIAG
jgi:hypothetical protein